MKTKKFFTEVQNFWAPKISAEISVESEDFCLQGNQRFPGPENPKSSKSKDFDSDQKSLISDIIRIFLVIKNLEDF